MSEICFSKTVAARSLRRRDDTTLISLRVATTAYRTPLCTDGASIQAPHRTLRHPCRATVSPSMVEALAIGSGRHSHPRPSIRRRHQRSEHPRPSMRRRHQRSGHAHPTFVAGTWMDVHSPAPSRNTEWRQSASRSPCVRSRRTTDRLECRAAPLAQRARMRSHQRERRALSRCARATHLR